MLPILLLSFLAGLIWFFVFGITRKPFRKSPDTEMSQTGAANLPWGLQRYGVGEEALASFLGESGRQSLFEELLERMGRQPVEEEIMNATLFGLEIGLQSDDYAHAGIEFEAADFVEKQLAKIEFELFDTDIYSQHQFYAHAILVMHDMLGQQRSDSEKQVLQESLQKYGEKLAELAQQLKFQFKGMQIAEIGTRRDRESFYFKMAITNYLRSKNIVPELDQLYRIYGVNYQVEKAFQIVTQALPVFQKLLDAGIQQLAQQSVLELERFIHHELKSNETSRRLPE
jgi:hypothetical protein